MFKKVIALKNHKGFMKYFKNTSWLFVEKILRMVVGLFVGIWVARYLGPEQFGLFSYAQSFVVLFSVFSNMSMEGILIRELVKYPEKNKILLNTAFVLRIFSAIISIIFLIIIIFLLNIDEYSRYFIIIMSFTMFFQIFNIIDYYFQSQVLSKYVVIVKSIVLIVSSLLKILFIVMNKPLIYFVVLYLLDSFMIACLFLIIFYKKSRIRINLKVDMKIFNFLLRECIYLIPTAFIILAYMKVDQIMLRHLLDSSAVGYYAAATKLIEPLYIIPLVIVNSLYPKLIQDKANNNKNFYKGVFKLLQYLYIYSLIIVCIYFFFSSEIISLLYGSSYSKSADILSVNAFLIIFISMRYVIGRLFLIENLIKVYFMTSLIGLMLNILFNYLLISKYGVIGASYATLLSFFIATYLIYVVFKKTRNIFFLQTRVFFNLKDTINE